MKKTFVIIFAMTMLILSLVQCKLGDQESKASNDPQGDKLISAMSKTADQLAWIEKNVQPILEEQKAAFERLDRTKAEYEAARAELAAINAKLEVKDRELKARDKAMGLNSFASEKKHKTSQP